MAMNKDSKENRDQEREDIKGRNWDQLTSGTTSAATMGAGATGDVADNALQPANQEPGRTDDLLAGGSAEEQGDEGFQGKTKGQGGQGSQSAAGSETPQGGK